MKRCTLLLTAIASSSAYAVEPIAVEELTPNSATDFGFVIEASEDGDIQLIGPAIIDGCRAMRSGTALIGANGDEVAAYISDFGPSAERPMATGYFTDAHYTMLIFIDYICAKNPSSSRRYHVSSALVFSNGADG